MNSITSLSSVLQQLLFLSSVPPSTPVHHCASMKVFILRVSGSVHPKRMKQWFNFLPLISPFPSCFSAVAQVSLSLDTSVCISGRLSLGLGVVWKCCCCMWCSLIALKIPTDNGSITEFLCKFMYSVQGPKLHFFLLEGSQSFVFV